MSRKLLLDTNLLIGAFDPQPGNAAHERARQRMRELLSDSETRPAISSLIRYEVMRGATNGTKAMELEEALNAFPELEIGRDIGNLAAEIFRFSKVAGITLDKRELDVLHFACAKRNDLSIETDDTKDFNKIERIYTDMTSATTDHAKKN